MSIRRLITIYITESGDFVLINDLFKKLHIKAKPEKVLTYIFYAISIVVALYSLAKILSLASGDIRISDWVHLDSLIPYILSILFIIPVLAFSFFVNSGIPKGDNQKINMFIFSCVLLALPVLYSFTTAVNWIAWQVLENLPKYDLVLS